jgi:TonB family protein
MPELLKRFLQIAWLSLYALTLHASSESRPDARQLLEQAQDARNIFALPAFQLKAQIHLLVQDKPLEGSYLLYWNGPKQWREAIIFPGYTDITVAENGVLHVKRDPALLPLRVSQLHETLGFGSVSLGSSVAHPEPNAEETIKKIHDRKIDGVKVSCFEIAGPGKRSREVCAEETTHQLVREKPFVEKDPIEVGGKIFPRSLSYFEEGKQIVQVHITELAIPDRFGTSTFDPPPGSISRAGCMNPSQGHPILRISPKYPDLERSSRTEGQVAIYAVLGTDGVPRDLQIVTAATPGLNQASLDAVKQWRYGPSTCDGTPVEMEVVIVVNYEIGK